ncbi:MAG: thiamine phosphate synthase [Hydrotalea sp.]|nr:thiamine phosphate synthase [Hydrotalea sp.]
MFRLCLVTAIGDRPLPDYLQFLRAVARGGVDCVEWREKHQAMEKTDQARAIKKLLDELHVPFLINDYPDIAQAIDASGVHLGNSDMAVDSARTLLGPNKTIGMSIESEQDMARAIGNSAINYVTASAVFASHNKTDTKKIWGIDGLKKLAAQAGATPSPKPITAIGGITLDNVGDVMATGVYGVAVIGALHDSPDPETTARVFRRIIDNSKQ